MIIAYRAAIEIDSKNVEAYIGLAEVNKAMGSYRQELEVLQEGIAQTQDTRLSDLRMEAKQLMSASVDIESAKGSNTVETTESTPEPTVQPTVEPIVESTPEPTVQPTVEPISPPTPTYSTIIEKYIADGDLPITKLMDMKWA